MRRRQQPQRSSQRLGLGDYAEFLGPAAIGIGVIVVVFLLAWVGRGGGTP